jgi:hypothetical protein
MDEVGINGLNICTKSKNPLGIGGHVDIAFTVSGYQTYIRSLYTLPLRRLSNLVKVTGFGYEKANKQ